MSVLTTVIVPNYNHARSLRHCLAAIAEQTYAPLEVVVVDDGSTDDSVAVARAAGVHVLTTGSNQGPSTARNRGARWASGEILFFVDADGALAPDAVATAVALLEANPDVGAVCGIEAAEPRASHSWVEDYRALQHHYWCVASEGDVSFLYSALFAMRRDVFAEAGPFNPALRWTEEVDFGDRLGRSHRIVSTSTVTGSYDFDHELGGLLRKIFHRVRARIPLYARRRRFAQGYETPSRAYSSVAALLSLVTLPLVTLGAGWLLVPGALLAGSLACDAAMFRFVLRRRGPVFAAYFAGLHFLVNVVIATAVGVGVLQWLTSRRFRRLYDPRPVGTAGAAA